MVIISMHTQETYEHLHEMLEQSGRYYDYDMIKKAFDVAKKAHEGQLRRSGEPYFQHPLHVAEILVELGMDTESIVAALLHDVVEDTDTTLDDIRKMFGKQVANLVDGVTKLGKVPYSSREEQQAENVRKMLLAMSQDIRVIIIKLADRLHNMRTLQYMPDQKRRDKAKETMDVYAPIAHRLGIRAVKEELEDISIHYLDPVAVSEIEQSLAKTKNEREELLNLIIEHIRERLKDTLPNAYMEGRVKSVNGIYRKMYIQGKTFEEIYDIYAVRIIVDTVNDCYNVLGIIHDMYRPIPGRFKDYISTPKANMYQSLHTTVLGRKGTPFEVQIRTWDMHHTAEYGIAAHWKYKLGLKGRDNLEERLAWIRQMIENQKDSEDVEDIVRTIKTDLAPEEVFVFTPKGDVKNLPAGSTVIDFAYAIHSAVGNRMNGAKVDGKIVPLDYQVKTGEIVEVLTSGQNKGPSRDWLKIVKTSEARNKIKAWFKKEMREENIVVGKTEFEKELTRCNIRLPEDKLKQFLEMIAERQHCATVDDLYAAIGYGGILLSKLIPRIREAYNRLIKTSEFKLEDALAPEKETKTSGGVVIEGIDNCLVKFSRCCNPLPGDEIIGFITRGFGVSVHKRDCVNVPKDLSTAEEPERWIKCHWDNDIKSEFKASICVQAPERTGLIADISTQLASMHIMIISLNAREPKAGMCTISITIIVNGKDHLASVIQRLSRIPGITDIERE